MKYAPRITVNDRAWMASLRFFFIILWWAQVIVTPDDSKTAVFRSGTKNGLRGVIPVGGQETPISILGARLL